MLDRDDNCIETYNPSQRDTDAGFNRDGRINFTDLVVIKYAFMEPPGPSALTDQCDAPWGASAQVWPRRCRSRLVQRFPRVGIALIRVAPVCWRT